MISHSLKGARVYDLLDTSIYLGFSQRPQRLAEELTSNDHIVVIDEIQRLPVLLNEVHRLIEKRGIRFLLTGSSARKLQQGGVNLLGGRARTKYLHPLTSQELGNHFDLDRLIARGGLHPSISQTTRRLTSMPTPALISNKRSSPKERQKTSPPSAVS